LCTIETPPTKAIFDTALKEWMNSIQASSYHVRAQHDFSPKLRFCISLPPSIFSYRIVTPISRSLGQETQNTNHGNSLKTLNNQNNNKIFRVICPKCAGSLIGATHNVHITRFQNGLLRRWLKNLLLCQKLQMLPDLDIPEPRSHRPKILAVPRTDRTSEFRTVKWSRPRQLRQPFRTKNF
jgi:hypothetical protein